MHRRSSSVARIRVGVLVAALAGAVTTNSWSQDVDPPSAIAIADGPVGAAPDGWFVPTPGWAATILDDRGPSGRRVIRLRPNGQPDDQPGDQPGGPFGNVMRTLDADELRGVRVELTANLRTSGPGHAQMWIRVDRADRSMGAFDNMGDRPVRGGEWQPARIVVEIDADAAFVNVGVMAIGGATVEVDDLRLLPTKAQPGVQPPDGPRLLTGRALDNVVAASRLLSYLRFFHPSAQCVGVVSWDHVAVALIEAAEPATDSKDLADRLRAAIEELAPTVALWAGTPDARPEGLVRDSPPNDVAPLLHVWRHRGAGSASSKPGGQVYMSVVQSYPRAVPPEQYDLSPVVVELGGGVSMHMPIALVADGDGTLPHGEPPERWTDVDALPRLTTANRRTRLASVALGWGVFQHFYPYFDVVEELFGVDWDAALPEALRAAAEADGPAAHVDVLKRLVAKLHDGHGRVFNQRLGPRSFLPIGLEWAGEDLVVVQVRPDVDGQVRIGDAIVAIDGRPIEECVAELATRISWGTQGWLDWMVAGAIVGELRTDDPAALTLRAPDGVERTALVARGNTGPPMASRDLGRFANGAPIGAPIGDPAEAIVYFDLRGAVAEELVEHLGALVRARAIIFDLRGYPDSGAMRVLLHLISAPVRSAKWMTPMVHRPDRDKWTWDESGRWNLAPMEPRLDQPVAFLTDGRAISYAESILGIVAHHGLGEIVGSPTAGANGNVNPIELPGGDTVMWTGMKVLKHDGTRHHALGILPTVPVEPTQQGIAEGRDEVLEKAVEVLRAKLGSGG